ncbi:hypothetical protein ACJJTC_008874 [Scirpophaga incertulas]
MDIKSVENKNESEMDKTSGDTQILQDSVGDSDCTLTEEAKEDTSTESSDYVPSDYEDCVDTQRSSYKPDRPVRERRAPDRFGFGGLCYTEMDSGTAGCCFAGPSCTPDSRALAFSTDGRLNHTLIQSFPPP